MKSRADICVAHIGAGRYRPVDRSHVTYGIWSELARGFRQYHAIARSAGSSASWRDGNLKVSLLRSWIEREAEFLITQFGTLPILIRGKPDVIVCQSPVSGGIAALAAARASGAKLLVELHADIYFQSFARGSKRWWLHHLSRPALQRANRIRVLSSGMLEQLADSFGQSIASKAVVLPPRVDTDLMRPTTDRHPRADKLRLITVGSLVSRKGQLRLIRALANPPFEIDLHLVGEGPDRAECERLGQRTGKLKVICHGHVNPHDLPQLLANSDIFVLYSNSEGTPRAIMEAMACGLPVVTTDAGFCSDIVEDGREGFVLGPDPDREILSVLKRFRDDPLLATRMGAAGRERAVRDYDSVRLYEEYRRLIEETASA